MNAGQPKPPRGRAEPPTARVGIKASKEVFFFEKKKQKTFGIGVRLDRVNHTEGRCPKK